VRTNFALGIVDALFVRAADDALGGHDGFDSVPFEKLDDPLRNYRIMAYVAFGEEPYHLRFRVLSHDDSDSYLARAGIVRTVKRYG
jgi:hypothetical protein